MDRIDNVQLKNKITGVIFHLSPIEAKRILNTRDSDDYEVIEGAVEVKKVKPKTKTVKEMVVAE